MKTRLVRMGTLILMLGLAFAFLTPQPAMAQSAGDYRTAQSGNWNAISTWQTFSGGTWIAAATTPTSASGAITIRNGHTVTVTANVTVDQVTIEVGGQVTVNNGVTWTIDDPSGVDLTVNGTLSIAGTVAPANGPQYVINGTVINAGAISVSGAGSSFTFNANSLYQHSRNGGTVPTATWNAASTVEIIGTTTAAPAGGLGQTFGNFTWNSTGQTSSVSLGGSLTTVNGNFTLVSTGGGASELQLVNTSGSDRALAVGGNVDIQGGNLDLFNSNDNNDMTVNIAGTFNLSGGTVTSGNADSPTVINFTGAASQFTQSGGTFTTTNINFGVNTGASLTLNNDLNVAGGRTFTITGALNCASAGSILGALTSTTLLDRP